MATSTTPVSAPRTARQRARADLTRQIVETARKHLETDGATGLSLRAVARDLGMVSSAVYRYVASRDELLTLLIIEAYDALGAAAERAEGRLARDDLVGRWYAIGRAIRRWAVRHPHEYALIFGSPVPGYAAPQATVGPAGRVPVLLITVLVDAVEHGVYDPEAAPPVSPPVAASIAPVRSSIPPQVPDDLAVWGLIAWSHLIGAVSFELFGHFQNVIGDSAGDREAFYDEQLRRLAGLVGLVDRRQPPLSGAGARPRPAAGTG